MSVAIQLPDEEAAAPRPSIHYGARVSLAQLRRDVEKASADYQAELEANRRGFGIQDDPVPAALRDMATLGRDWMAIERKRLRYEHLKGQLQARESDRTALQMKVLTLAGILVGVVSALATTVAAIAAWRLIPGH